MTGETEYDLVIIGSGPAGLTAAIYGTRLGLKTAVIGKDYGMSSHAFKIENFPSHESIPGLELIQKITDQAKKLGAELINEEVVAVSKNSVQTKSNKTIKGKYFILAIGTKHKELHIPREHDFLGKGVSYCAVCDAAFFKNKTVAVVGGNDAAATTSLLLSEYAEKVYILYRKDYLRAEHAWVEKINQNKKIEIIPNVNVAELFGENMLEGVKLDNGDELKLQGLFIEIGSMPSTTMIKSVGIETDEKGFIKVDQAQKTNIDKFYAAGDATTGSNRLRQVITACSEGAIAAEEVYKRLKKEKEPTSS